MLFNKQATEIINLATNKDPELEQILKYALSKLTDGQKEKIKNGENFSIADFYDNGSCKNSVQFEIRPDYLDTTLQIVNYEENGESTEYELDVFGFDKQAVEDLDNETSIENLKKYFTANLLFNFKICFYDMNKNLNFIKEYVLELGKVKNDYVLNYNRSSKHFILDRDDNSMVEAESVTSIEKEELDNIAGLGDSVSL